MSLYIQQKSLYARSYYSIKSRTRNRFQVVERKKQLIETGQCLFQLHGAYSLRDQKQFHCFFSKTLKSFVKTTF